MFGFVNKIVIFILLVLLILSFGLWGIGDVIQGGGDKPIAEVNGVPIMEREYQSIVNSQVRQMAEIYQQSFDEGMRRLLETRVLSNLIDDELMKQFSESLGVSVGTKQAVMTIRDKMEFISGGEFDKEAFNTRLRGMGLSEYGYIEEEIKPEITTEMIMNIFHQQPMIPSKIIEVVHGYEGEKREVEMLTIPADYKVEVPEPSAEQISTYYEENKTAFKAPEYRTITYVEFDKAVVAEDIAVADEMLKVAYEERLGEFTAPEKRAVLQMSFNTEEEAQKAHERVSAGEDFATVALDMGVTEASLNALGEIEVADVDQNQFYPAKMADAVFTIERDAMTEPMKSSLGWHLYKVTDILPGEIKPLEEVSAMLRHDIEEQFANDMLYELSIQAEDEIAGGSSLEELARELNVKVQKTEEVDVFGRLLSEGAAKDIPRYGNFLSLAFDQKVGQVTDVIPSPDGLGYFLLRVDNVVAERQQALEEVESQVINAWKIKNKETLIAKVAHDASQAIKSGKTLSEQATAMGLEVAPAAKVYRERVGKDVVPDALRKDLFSMQENEISNPASALDGSYVIARLVKVIPAIPDDEVISLDKVKEKMQDDYEENIKKQFLFELQYRYPVMYSLRQ